MRTHKIFQFVRTFLIALIFINIVGCSTDAGTNHFVCPEPSPRIAIENNSIHILTWAEYVPVTIIECFGSVYNVGVTVDYFSSNEELYSNVAIDDGATTYDVIHPSDYMIGVLIREELLEKLDTSKLQNYANFDPDLISVYQNSLDYVVPYQMGTQGIAYNSETVTKPPTSWADLWNLDYANRIVAVDDSRVIIGAALLALGYDVNTTNESELQEAKQKLSELMPNIYEFDSDSPSTLLVEGEVDLGIVWNGEAFLAQQENSAIQYVFPEEGSIIFYDGMAIPANAVNVDVAYAWFNYLLQGDVNWLTLVDYPYTNPNQAALNYAKENAPEIYNAYINSKITNTPAEEFIKGHEILDLGFALLLYNDIWLEAKP